MPDPAVRLFRLLTLFQSRPNWSGLELADRLEVTPRTVRRDVDRLRQLGFPVDAAPGATGGYQLAPGASLPPLVLDDDEAVAVAVCLQHGADGTVAGLGEAAASALDKLERLLPSRLRPRVTALGTMTVRLPTATEGQAEVEPEVLVSVAEACRGSERIRFAYRDGQGRPSERTVEPHRVVRAGRRWYLAARDVRRDAWRTFRIDRMTDLVSTGHRFTLVDPPDAGALVQESISIAPYRYRARVELQLPLRVAETWVPAATATLEAIDDETTLLSTGGDDLASIALHLLHLGCPFTVLEPPELHHELHVLAARLVAADPTSPVG